MHLHDEPGRNILARAPGIDRDHGALDDVGGGALHRRVDGAALGVLLGLFVAGADIRQVQTPSVDSLDITSVAGALARLVHEAPYSGVALEITLPAPLRRRATHT